jgi:hypothetical protein
MEGAVKSKIMKYNRPDKLYEIIDQLSLYDELKLKNYQIFK